MSVSRSGGVVAARTEAGMSVIEVPTGGIEVGDILWGELDRLGESSLRDNAGLPVEARVIAVGATHSKAQELLSHGAATRPANFSSCG